MMRASSIMSTSVLTMKNLSAYDCIVSSGTCIQSVRWKRKPIWLPTAKSKIFRIPKKPEIPEEEKREIQRLYNNYRTCFKSLMYHCHLEPMKSRVTTSAEVIHLQQEKDFVRCKAINDKWNEQLAKEREVRLAKEWEKREQEIIEKLEQKKERDLLHLQKIEESVRKVKEAASTFITPETVDDAIDQCLDTIVNHNRAIDLNGNFYDSTLPEAKQMKGNVSETQVQQ